jgi:hypothetical protein
MLIFYLLSYSQGPNLVAIRSIMELGIADLVPIEGDIAIEDLAAKAGVEPDLLGMVSWPLSKI